MSRIGLDCAHAELAIKLHHARAVKITHKGARWRVKSGVFISEGSWALTHETFNAGVQSHTAGNHWAKEGGPFFNSFGNVFNLDTPMGIAFQKVQ